MPEFKFKETIRELHFKYWIGILAGIIVFTMTRKLGNMSLVVDQIGFAATLASLMLAVLAIIYSFVSNQSLTVTFGKLDSAASSIGTATQNVISATNTLEQKIDEIPTIIADKMSEIHPLITEMSEKVEATQSLISGHLQTILTQSPPTTPTPIIEDSEGLDIETFYSRISLMSKFILLACVEFQQKNKLIDLDILSKEFPVIDSEYSHGFLVATHASNLISLSYDMSKPKRFSIEYIQPSLIEISRSQIFQSIEEMSLDEEFKGRLFGLVGKIKLLSETLSEDSLAG